jgi:serpin B
MKALSIIIVFSLLLHPAAAEDALLKKLIEGNNTFALNLYRRVSSSEGNLFFSPHSISQALAMTSAGARGKTLEEIRKTMSFQVEQDQLHLLYAAMQRNPADKSEPEKYNLSIANAFWVQNDFKLNADFQTILANSYRAKAAALNFATDTETARTTINKWVEAMTKEKIKDLLAPGVLTPDTRLVLTNAIYFKGTWETTFTKDRTRDGDFTLLDRSKIKVPLMRGRAQHKLAQHEGCDALQMRYDGGDVAMLILLPTGEGGLPALEKSLTLDYLNTIIAALKPTLIDVTLPKFTMTRDFQLASELTAMGMPTAFTQRADFSGIAGLPGESFITAVVHKAFVAVDEQGTQAAAATAVSHGGESVSEPDPQFIADHPFLFFIRNVKSGEILFAGRVMNPK